MKESWKSWLPITQCEQKYLGLPRFGNNKKIITNLTNERKNLLYNSPIKSQLSLLQLNILKIKQDQPNQQIQHFCLRRLQLSSQDYSRNQIKFHLITTTQNNINFNYMIANFIRRYLTTNITPLSLYSHFRFSQQNSSDKNYPVQITKENALLIIDKWVKQNKVVLFMKGTPHCPECGFSNYVVQLLKKYGLTEYEYKSINVLENPIIREQAKRYRNWPTFPQLYIDGQLIGGSNILLEMHKDKSLQALLQQKKLI